VDSSVEQKEHCWRTEWTACPCLPAVFSYVCAKGAVLNCCPRGRRKPHLAQSVWEPCKWVHLHGDGMYGHGMLAAVARVTPSGFPDRKRSHEALGH
jgi:hypothetical protein